MAAWPRATSAGTPWLLMFCLFLFLSLAVVKRCSELVARRAAGKTDVMGRSYRVEDLQVLLPLAAAAGYGAVLVVALYLSSPDVRPLYAHPGRMWLICPLWSIGSAGSSGCPTAASCMTTRRPSP